MYESHGFTRLGLRKRYYQPSDADAYTMGRPPSTSDEPVGGSGSEQSDSEQKGRVS
jgi:ribosomal-protein-alanine N-acetyltransferase